MRRFAATRFELGFSALELVCVVGIMLVVSAMAMPSIVTTVGSIRVRSSAESFAGLLQQARTQAAKNNRFYSVIPNSSMGPNIYRACIDLNWNGACDAGEPDVELSRNVSLVTSGGPSTAVITCGATLGPATCPTGYTGLNFSPQAATVVPSFSARALPCANSTPSTQPVWPTVLCYTTDQSVTGHPPIGFLYVFQYNGMLTPSYSAVAVTPAGRIAVLNYSGKDGSGNDVWQ
ncbi:MAG: GspH/FimT family pseudopilin [Acidobacteria bacterium]|nr:GspH/FimT family pseudopilin [Acidobacteriota bacterium]